VSVGSALCEVAGPEAGDGPFLGTPEGEREVIPGFESWEVLVARGFGAGLRWTTSKSKSLT